MTAKSNAPPSRWPHRAVTESGLGGSQIDSADNRSEPELLQAHYRRIASLAAILATMDAPTVEPLPDRILRARIFQHPIELIRDDFCILIDDSPSFWLEGVRDVIVPDAETGRWLYAKLKAERCRPMPHLHLREARRAA